jgi:hypothetical protein
MFSEVITGGRGKETDTRKKDAGWSGRGRKGGRQGSTLVLFHSHPKGERENEKAGEGQRREGRRGM